MRLDKMLAHCGYGSRKQVKEFIRKGYVMVNGEIITDDDYKVDEEQDEVIIAEEEVAYKNNIYLMLNKPDGYVSATYDNYDSTVLDLISGYDTRRLFPVGRLDKDTTGLLLITNDGRLAHRLLAPKNHVDKIYYLKYSGEFKESYHKQFENGITLEDGYKCMPAKFIPLGNQEGQILIREGKYHQVKRMMQAVNCEVTYLKRIQFGSLKLDEALKEGSFRPLTEQEIEDLRSDCDINY